MNTNKNQKIVKKQFKAKQKVMLIIASILAVILVFVGIKYGPTYTEMFKQVQSAKISILNDDLEGALVSYEKAYEKVSQPSLLNEIERINRLINSKRAFIKAENFEREKKYDTAYVYYTQVIEEDKERYEMSQPKVKQLAEIVVENIYKQADDLYNSHLYAMVIGRLQNALDYQVKIEETEAKISEYKQLFFEYYCEQAIINAKRFFDNDAFYNLFARDLEHAKTYIQTTNQQTTHDELAKTLLDEHTSKYLTLALNAIDTQDKETAQKYLNRVLELDETNEQAKQLVESVK